MNSKIESNEQKQLFNAKDNINFEKEEIIKLINNEYDLEEIKKIIEAKVDYFMFNKYNNEIKIYEGKINDLLNFQESLFIKNEMIKEKIKMLMNYLDSLKKDDK